MYLRVLLGRKRYMHRICATLASSAMLYMMYSYILNDAMARSDGVAALGAVTQQGMLRAMKRQNREIPDAPALKGAKVILLWHARQWKKKYIDPVKCGRCVFTTNRSAINESDTGAVIFRSEIIDEHDMPSLETRRTDQLYIWSSGEPAPSLFHLRKMWLFWEDKYKFNMTMSYRRDSSLYHPYGTAAEAYEHIQKKGYAQDIRRLVTRKTRLAVAVVSNCISTPGARARLGLLQNLAISGLKVDLLGNCFTNSTVPKNKTEEFLNNLEEYKFYLAFENSYHCRDYITEKFYRNALYVGVVPVVWGTAKEDYAAVAPPGSFIHMEDYSTTNELIEYLNFLDRNNTAYLEYFRWYATFSPQKETFSRDYSYCVLCMILHARELKSSSAFMSASQRYFLENATQRTIPSLRSWFYNNQRDCLRTNLRLFGNGTKIN